jgi:hypothetical protein
MVFERRLFILAFAWFIVASRTASYRFDDVEANRTHRRQRPINADSTQCFAPQISNAIETVLGGCNDGELQRSVETLINPYSVKGCELGLPYLASPSCSMECGPGEYLSADQYGGICKKCPAGTFSIGQGSVLDHFSRIPPQLTSMCFSFDLDMYYSGDSNVWKKDVDCAKWESSEDGSHMHSGNNKDLDYIESYLILHLRFVRKGTLWFTFQVKKKSGVAFYLRQEQALVCCSSRQHQQSDGKTLFTVSETSFICIISSDCLHSFCRLSLRMSAFVWAGASYYYMQEVHVWHKRDRSRDDQRMQKYVQRMQKDVQRMQKTYKESKNTCNDCKNAHKESKYTCKEFGWRRAKGVKVEK